MAVMKLLLITGRSLKQGTGLNIGKDSPEYKEAVTGLEMNDSDMVRLGLQNGDAVQLSSLHGQVAVRCRKGDLPEGLAFMAYGPASSTLLGAETHASGMPSSKHIEVEIQAAASGRA